MEHNKQFNQLSKMAAPPRKFNEKIALLHAKEMEDAAAFESVMADVKNITRQHRIPNAAQAAPLSSGSAASLQQPPLPHPSQNASPTRQPNPTSLPDYSINLSHNNSMRCYQAGDGLQEAVNDLHSLKKEVYSSSPHATATTTTLNNSHSRHHSPHHPHHPHHHHPHHPHPHHRNSTSPIGRISGPSKSGFGGGGSPVNHPPTHLSPPPDSLPRSNSVPSLHQHMVAYPTVQPLEGNHLLGVPYRPKSMLDVSPHQHR
ncbi:uncharacterized histidine-rich protein DDB_G0274557-like [Hyalella azteca]|uniref:Uncharacterized histidine-rich protein DDB_G0274557-like n=1 Tax=Hyalella azteca TaxID=294128 RepID=A0A979FIE0_HYAAZ|nr:uncharacterized histidine-rich protein DDB_G0274557-like [Hyalella azteca]